MLLTIGQLASFAGVTVRAVRHYHSRGLLPEPDRDASGYRRYDAQDVVALIRIKTLAEAGVPLARVSELLQADPDRFELAIAEIDDDLQSRVEQLQEHRRRVATLATGDGMALPEDVVAYLARLRKLGLSERIVGIERDGWIMLAVYAPDRVIDWIRLKHESLADERYRDLYVELDKAFDWSPDDSRLPEFADRIADLVRQLPATQDSASPTEAEFDQTVVALMDAQTVQESPAWRRLQSLVEKRGLIGWTNIRQANGPNP